jgi:hypothetical protein
MPLYFVAWVDLYIGFGLKNTQENQVQETPFADSSIDIQTKCLDNKFRLQGRLRCVDGSKIMSFVC